MTTDEQDHLQHEREQTREALAQHVDAFERRVRAQLDWKARLRRDAPQIAAIGGAIIAVAVAGYLLRRKLRAGSERRRADELNDVSLDDLARQLRELREEIDRHGRGSIAAKLASSAVGAAASAAGRTAATRLMDRSEEPAAAA